jgi:hypothetical protein
MEQSARSVLYQILQYIPYEQKLRRLMFFVPSRPRLANRASRDLRTIVDGFCTS